MCVWCFDSYDFLLIHLFTLVNPFVVLPFTFDLLLVYLVHLNMISIRKLTSSLGQKHQMMCTGLRNAVLFRESPTTPTRTLAYVSNKRITRIPSDTEVDQSELNPVGNERFVSVRVPNRNPRNLEQMLLAHKPMGHELDQNNPHYWNKIVFEKKSQYLVGRIVHYSGRTVLSAASNEPAIASKLSSALGLSAAQLLGTVLSLRALESGIHSVHSDYDLHKEASSKLSAFISSFEANVSITEQPFIFARSNADH